MKKYNHAFTIAFEVETGATYEEDDYPTKGELISALKERIASLEANGDEIFEAVGKPYDTYEV